MRLNPGECGQRIEPGITQDGRRHEVPRRARAANLRDEAPRHEPPQPRTQRASVRKLELLRELDRQHSFGLRDEPERDALPLSEGVTTVSLDEQSDDTGLDHTARNGDMDGVGSLDDGRDLAATREQPLEEQVDAAPFALHQLQIVKDARHTVVPATARVEDVLRRDAYRQPAGVHDLEAIGVQVQVQVSALRIRPMHERVHEQLAHDELVIRR